MRVAAQMETAQALYGQDAAFAKSGMSQLQRVAGQLPPLGVGEDQPRPADRTGHGLGMETAVSGITVLFCAVAAHGKTRHGGAGAVIGQAFDDGEAGATVGTVGKGVTVAAIRRIPHVGQAIRAGGHIRRDQCLPAAAGAVQDAEIDLTAGRDERNVQSVDGGQVRRVLAQGGDEGVHVFPLPFRLHGNAGGMVEHPAGQPMFPRQAVNEGAKAHTLHDAADLQTGADGHARSSLRRACICSQLIVATPKALALSSLEPGFSPSSR